MKQSRSQQTTSLVVQVIPHHATDAKETHALETTIQSLVHGEAAIALELVRTAQGRQFLVRATTAAALDHLVDQIQARYPQAEIRPVPPEHDPLLLKADDVVSVLELRGSVPYLPLRSWAPRELQTRGADPLLGILAALDQAPDETCVITQLVLTPIPPAWARRYQRMRVEHPLAPEQRRERRTERASQGNTTSWFSVIAMACVAAGAVLWQRLQVGRFVPAWVWRAALALLHGTAPQLTHEQQQQVSRVGIGGVLLLAVLMVTIRLLVTHFFGQTRLYEMKQVAEKIGKSAFLARLRLSIHEPALKEVVLLPPTGLLEKHAWVHQLRTDVHRRWTMLQARRAQRQRLRDLEQRLITAYRQYHTADAYFVPHRLSIRALSRSAYAQMSTEERGEACWQPAWWTGIKRARLILSSQEIGSLWHLPQGEDLSEIAGVEQRQERSLPVPHVLTTGDGWMMGVSPHAGKQVSVSFPTRELARHSFVMGRTGKGKSTLFQHLALAQLSASGGHGLCLVEPHGDLTHALLAQIPLASQNKVTLIDLANRVFPPGINPLDMSDATETDKLVSSLIQTLKKIWEGSWGSRIENVSRFSFKTLAEANKTLVTRDPVHGPEQQYTLLDMTALLNRQNFRRSVLELIEDIHIKDWWRNYYERLDTDHQDDIITPVITKLSAFASSPVIRRVIGQPRSTISFRQTVQTGGILLVNTASGVVGADVSSLLGATILGLFSTALAEQLEQRPQDRQRFQILVDEFSNYPVDYKMILGELRKAGVALTLATQSLMQLESFDPALRPTILANSDHLFIFTLAGEDAWLLRHELSTVQPEDIVNLQDYSCYAKWSLDGHRLPLFSLHFDLPPQGDQEVATRIRERSEARDGRNAEEVDAWIAQLAQRHYVSPEKKKMQDDPGAMAAPKKPARSKGPREGMGERG